MEVWFGQIVIQPRRQSGQVPSGTAAITWTRSPTAHGWPSDGRADIRADLDDLAGDLVAHDPRRVDVLVARLVDLDVRAAGRAVADPDLDLGRTGRGFGDVLDPDVAGRVEPGDLHAWDSSAA